MPERIMLLFGGKKENEEQMDSGFGPFGLSRLAYETGGLYFTVHPNRKTGKKIEQINVAEPWTANICFGGKDHQTLFITASKCCYTLAMRVKGAGSQ